MNNDSTFLSSASTVPADTASAENARDAVGPSFSTSRRAFLTLTLAGCAAGCAALAGCGTSGDGGAAGSAGPAVTPLVTATRTGDSWLVPGAGALTPGSAVQFIAGGEPILVIGANDGVHAFSGRCTHMGCAVEWHGNENRFVCPCHASKFDATGKVLNGPAARPLPAYGVKKQGSDAVVTVKA